MNTLPTIVDVTSYTLRDRLDLSLEILSIADALTGIEQQHGRSTDTEELRCRLQQVQIVVLGQLRALLDGVLAYDRAATSNRIH